jgi:transitional endoplasmic reticulum ATPase
VEGYNKANESRLLDTLRQLGGKQITDQSGIRNHSQTYIAKPEPMTKAQLADVAVKAARADEEETAFSRTFNYRPWDGAHAFQSALMKAFGHSGNGIASQSMFGKVPPQRVTIEVGPGQTTQIPWGEVDFPLLGGVFLLGGVRSEEWGTLFSLTFTGPKKREGEVEGIFKLIQDELENHSIYKGQAITGADMPQFLDPWSVDRSKVVYNKEVERSIIGLLWHPLRYADRARQRGVSLKRSMLLGGPYGTGKSLAAMLTAQEAVQNGWTFIQCRPGKDDLDQVMKTAQLYQPSVVFYEDIDTIAQDGEPLAVQKLLDTFDGISAKGTELMVVLTTNHINRIHKGMLRPGRMDGIIEIAGLDPQGCARLVLSHSVDRLNGDREKLLAQYEESAWVLDDKTHPMEEEIDLEHVGQVLSTFREPAFVAEIIRYVELFNLDKESARYTTQDFIDAAEALKFQWNIYNDAGEGTRRPTLDEEFKKLLGETVKGYRVDVDDNWQLKPVDVNDS